MHQYRYMYVQYIYIMHRYQYTQVHLGNKHCKPRKYIPPLASIGGSHICTSTFASAGIAAARTQTNQYTQIYESKAHACINDQHRNANPSDAVDQNRCCQPKTCHTWLLLLLLLLLPCWRLLLLLLLLGRGAEPGRWPTGYPELASCIQYKSPHIISNTLVNIYIYIYYES